MISDKNTCLQTNLWFVFHENNTLSPTLSAVSMLLWFAFTPNVVKSQELDSVKVDSALLQATYDVSHPEN